MILLLASLVVLILLIAWVRVHAFVALIVVAVLTGLAARLSPMAVLRSVQNGVGETLGGIVLVLGFGVLLGNLLAVSGATTVISGRLLAVFGPGRTTWALALTGFVIGLAMFYNAGFVVLAPLVFSVAAQTGQPLVPLAIAMAAPLSVTHGFLPPHPGATAVVHALGGDLGKTLLLGLILAVPAGVVAAVVFPKMLTRIPSHPPKGIFREQEETPARPPSFFVSLFTAVLPVILMGGATLALLILPEGHVARGWLSFFGDSGTALLLAVLALLSFLVAARRQPPGATLGRAAEALGAIAGLMLIIAGGGAYKQVLLDSGLGQRLADHVIHLPFSPLILGWLIATALRIAVGSATVAGITAAGIVLPLVRASGASPELMALAIGAGSLMCSHVNDTGFWMFREWFGLSIVDTFRTWTLMETIVGLTGLLGVLGLSLWF
jgi:Gnt-I system high-affinity gluconate transporter